MDMILSIRAQTESLEADDEALALLGDIGVRTSLRYAVQLLTPSRIMAGTQGRDKITVADVEEIDELVRFVAAWGLVVWCCVLGGHRRVSFPLWAAVLRRQNICQAACRQ